MITIPNDSPSARLFTLTKECPVPLPSGVVPAPYQLAAPDFWPGGLGHDPSTPFPHGGIMCLGHNWGVPSDWDDTLRNGAAVLKTNSTCRATLGLFARCDVPPRDVFLTNFFVHLMDAESPVGPFRGTGDAEYEKWTRMVFAAQIEAMRPRAVFVLGMHVPPLLAPMAAEFRAWARHRTLACLDTAGAAFVPRVTLSGDGWSHTFAASVLTHPSYRHINAKHRRYKGLVGDAAEMAMIHDALDDSGRRQS
jgi:hypothetical protein